MATFRPGWLLFDAQSARPNFGSGTGQPSASVLKPEILFRPYLHGGYELAPRNDCGGSLHLPITCLNLSIPEDDCIRK
jgi:hypothetical protein